MTVGSSPNEPLIQWHDMASSLMAYPLSEIARHLYDSFSLLGTGMCDTGGGENRAWRASDGLLLKPSVTECTVRASGDKSWLAELYAWPFSVC